MAVAMLSLCAAACADSDAGQVQLTATPAADRFSRAVDVRAQVTGRTTGLRYKWYSVAGEADPQDSDQPATVFTFAEDAYKDRVTLEVWRGEKRVMRSELDVTLDSARAFLANTRRPKLDVEITDIPPYDPNGGTDTRADISGRIIGELSSDYRVVVYARADLWYRQPTPFASVAIAPDGTWKTWTHTGSSYAAFAIRRDIGLSPRLDVLPRVSSNVVARVIVDGVRR
jgi:hypothetical protein